MGHELFVAADFTPEEIARRNKLAEAVIEGGLSVCKKCGQHEAGLDAPCIVDMRYEPTVAPYRCRRGL